MNASDALIIVVVGFLFTSRYPLAKFKQVRSSGWAFYLHAFAWGAVFCFVATLLLLLGDYFDGLTHIVRFLPIDSESVLHKIQNSTEHIKWFVWALTSLFLAWYCGYTTSKIPYLVKKASRKVAQENEFEQLLYDAANHGYLIAVSLDSRKVYVGFVLRTTSTDNLNKTEFFSILPLFSGYRDKDTLSLQLPTNYQNFYHSIKKDDKQGRWEEALMHFKVILPTSQVTIISYFDLAAHQEISKKEPEKIITRP